MNLTRNQKKYAGILGACALALGIDRVFLAPGEAEAGTANAPSVVGTHMARRARSDVAAPARKTVIPQTTISAQFEEIAHERQLDPTNVPNAFGVPPWMEIAPPPVVEIDDPKIQEFIEKHRLTAVMASGERGYAIVDGKRMRIGDTIDGFEVVAIKKRSIKLTSGRYEVELTLSAPSIQSGG